MMHSKQAKSLLERYRTGTCSPDEKQLVEQWYDQLVETGEWQWSEEEKEQLEQTMEFRLLQAINKSKKPFLTMTTKWWWAAASIIFMLGIGGYLMFFNKSGKQPEIVVKEQKHDVPAPTIARAMLKLDDGRIVYLDSVGNGQLAMQGNVSVIKTVDGKISYQSAVGGEQLAVKYNTISNPRGSKVQPLTLIDGTQVWLNAESSITYPAAFVGNERKVAISGEAYFEVTHDATRKFIVNANGVTVEVLGTHFNVNSYGNEGNIKVTLLEGSVKVKSEVSGASAQSGSQKLEVVIEPGQQAIVTDKISVADNVDLDEAIAWKNGKFQFGEKADIGTVMRQIARWYDVDVEYNGTFTKHFGGSISREVNISQVLKVLETTGNVKCKVEGRKVTVTPVSF